MEEDIQILKEWLEVDKKAFNNFFRETTVLPRKKEYCKLYLKRIKALENIIKGYKDSEDIMENAVKENLEYKEYIRELEEENQKLIYELQEKDAEIKFANRDIKVFETDFIPKSKIKEKIEEYKKRKENCNDIESEIRLDVKIRAYEELMEDK